MSRYEDSLCLEIYFGVSTNFLVFIYSLGFFFIYSMSRCAECNHDIDPSSHNKCRTHADCVRGKRYYAGLCGICHGLWSRAREFETNMEDATVAFDLLFPWVTGFGKNSRGRTPGQDFFVDAEERREFVYLRGIFKPRKRAASLDSSKSSIPSNRVSFCPPL